MAVVRKTKPKPQSLAEMTAAGRTFYKPSTKTPQQLGILSDAEIERRARGVTDTPGSAGASGAGGGLSTLDRYTQMIQKMLTGGGYRKPQDDLMAKLSGMFPGAQAGVNTAMDALAASLQAQQNPYAGFQAAQAQATPQLQDFLAAQGVSSQPVQEFASALNAQNQGQAAAFQNLANMLGSIQQANQVGAVGDVAAQRANLLNQLQQAQLGYGAQLESQAAKQQQDYMGMLLQALAKGGRPRKGRLM